MCFFFFSSRRRHTRFDCDWSSDVCSSDLQALHVTNQSLIFRSNPQAHSRLVGMYMLFYAVGSGLGALISTNAYARFGWHGVCVAGAASSLAPLGVWAARMNAAPATPTPCQPNPA